jgi:hypothetical protein
MLNGGLPAERFADTTRAAPAIEHYFTILTNLVASTSRGTVTLKSTDPLASSVIDPNSLATDVVIVLSPASTTFNTRHKYSSMHDRTRST